MTERLEREIERRLKAPRRGGWATDPTLTEKRLIKMKPATLKRLERLAQHLSTKKKRIGPMLIAALLLERAVKDWKPE